MRRLKIVRGEMRMSSDKRDIEEKRIARVRIVTEIVRRVRRMDINSIG